MTEADLRQARELSLQILFQKEFSDSFDYVQSIKHFQSQFGVKPSVASKTQNYILGVLEHIEAIDLLIESSSDHWKISRMALVDVNLLRLSIYELVHAHSPAPVAVIINEALEIAKKYSSGNSSEFINGVLDQIATEHRK